MKHDCPCFDCPESGHKQGQGCGIHKACEKYKAYYARRRKEYERRKKLAILNSYTKEAIERVKGGTRSNMKKFRNGGK
jgi:hypothetical protein